MTKKLHWWQFRLRTLMIFMVLVCGFFGWLMLRYNRGVKQEEAVAAIRKMGGNIYYFYEFKNDKPGEPFDGEAVPPSPQWLRDILGKDFLIFAFESLVNNFIFYSFLYFLIFNYLFLKFHCSFYQNMYLKLTISTLPTASRQSRTYYFQFQ